MSKSTIHNTPAKILGLSPEELEKIKEQFPYFNSARMLLLKQQHGNGSASDKDLSSSAVWSSDRKKLHDFLKRQMRADIHSEDHLNKNVPIAETEDSPEYSPVEQQELNPPETETTPPTEKIEEVILVEQEVEHIEEESLQSSDVIAQVKETESESEITTTSQPSIIEHHVIEKEEEEEPEEEETSMVKMPEERRFIISDHTFEEWVEHFKRGKHSVRKLIEDKPKAAEEAADELNRLIESSLPATFFHDKLESETQYAKGLENFIDNQKKKKASVNKHVETGLVTETLAKIYERQSLIERAIGVYEALILKNPEKSAYFAVQIERLKNK